MRDIQSLVIAIAGIVGDTIATIGEFPIIDVEDTTLGNTSSTRGSTIQLVIDKTNSSSFGIGGFRRTSGRRSDGRSRIRQLNPVISTRADNIGISSQIALLIQISRIVALPVTRGSRIPTSSLEFTNSKTDMDMITSGFTSGSLSSTDLTLLKDFTNPETQFGNILIVAVSLDPVHINQTMLTSLHRSSRLIPGKVTLGSSRIAIVNAFHNTITHGIGILLTSVLTANIDTIGSLMREGIGSNTFNRDTIPLGDIQSLHGEHEFLSHKKSLLSIKDFIKSVNMCNRTGIMNRFPDTF